MLKKKKKSEAIAEVCFCSPPGLKKTVVRIRGETAVINYMPGILVFEVQADRTISGQS